ncbi:hypothetical protein [Luteolibacter sp. AS25]|uniref:hypothetical protein n=1 Tax=Luteolibacter sp. AS25 TaxID=3135776 RepID=UPI00398A9877
MDTLAKVTALFTILSVSLAQSSEAAASMYNATYSGSSATAHVTISMDTSSLTGDFILLGTSHLESITMTVSGAVSGNGTFTKSDFNNFSFRSTQALDFTREIVGQNGFADFNFFGASPAPNGSVEFTLKADGGSSDLMVLTSLAPVPEPSSAAP